MSHHIHRNVLKTGFLLRSLSKNMIKKTIPGALQITYSEADPLQNAPERRVHTLVTKSKL